LPKFGKRFFLRVGQGTVREVGSLGEIRAKADIACLMNILKTKWFLNQQRYALVDLYRPFGSTESWADEV